MIAAEHSDETRGPKDDVTDKKERTAGMEHRDVAADEKGAEHVHSAPGSSGNHRLRRDNLPTFENIKDSAGEPVTCIWSLTPGQRYMLYKQWLKEVRRDIAEKIKSLAKKYSRLREEANVLGGQRSLSILRSAKVVGCTTSGAVLNYALMEALQPKLLVLEEAGEVFEAHVLTVLFPSVEQVILIGDHLQLRPKANEYGLSADNPSSACPVDISLFERLVNVRKHAVGEDALADCGALVSLNIQRRMHPEIASLTKQMYPKLDDHETMVTRRWPRGFARRVSFVDHHTPESRTNVSSSYRNKWEAEMVVATVRYAIQQGYAAYSIAVLTPYLGQLSLLRDALKAEKVAVLIDERTKEEMDARFESGTGDAVDHDKDNDDSEEADKPTRDAVTRTTKRRAALHHVRLSTVDNFQGEEADVVIVSFVRSNDQRRLGFLSINSRVNVMLSRARECMIIFGSASTIDSYRKENIHIKAVMRVLREQGAVHESLHLVCPLHKTKIEICRPDDYKRKCPDGGCDEKCGDRLPCGHPCPKSCHPNFDPQHETSFCGRDCENDCIRGHKCPSLCGTCSERGSCKPCSTPMKRTFIACGHVVEVDCSMWDSPDVRCTFRVDFAFPLCGHVRKVKCGDRRLLEKLVWSSELIDDKQNILWRCDHKCESNERVPGDGQQVCSHKCIGKCGKCSRITFEKGEVKLEEGKPLAPIHRTYHHVECRLPCGRNLVCSHTCSNVCHPNKDCENCTQPCEVMCSHKAKCPNKCGEPCYLCAEECKWKCTCEDKQQCPLPCGSACIRLPCDKRCTQMLVECGHRCPSVCGEKCPPSDYCRECIQAEKVDKKYSGYPVDIFEGKTLMEVDPSVSPLVVLPCKHAFAAETLDGAMFLNDYYERDEKNEKWLRAKEMPIHPKRPTCPSGCGHPVTGIYRYGRVVNHYTVSKSQRIWSEQQIKTAEGLAQRARKVRSDAEGEFGTREGFKVWKKKRDHAMKDVVLLMGDLKGLREADTTGKVVRGEEGGTIHQVLAREQRFWRSESAALFPHPARVDPPMLSQPLLPLYRALIDLHLAALNVAPACENDKDFLKASRTAFDGAMSTVAEYRTLCKTALLQRSERHAAYMKATVLAIWVQTMHGRQVTRHASAEAKGLLKLLDEDPEWQEDERFAGRAEQYRKLANGILSNAEMEEIRMVIRALEKDVGSGSGSFGGHWYTCRNGHAYAIGECGGAMEEGKCIECGAPVGGRQHRVQEDNMPANELMAMVHGPVQPSNWRENADRNLQIPPDLL